MCVCVCVCGVCVCVMREEGSKVVGEMQWSCGLPSKIKLGSAKGEASNGGSLTSPLCVCDFILDLIKEVCPARVANESVNTQ